MAPLFCILGCNYVDPLFYLFCILGCNIILRRSFILHLGGVIMCSENRWVQNSLWYAISWELILSLLASIRNNVWAYFLVHYVLHTSSTVLWYHWVFTQFSLHVWVSDYTSCLMIANLLYLNNGMLLSFPDSPILWPSTTTSTRGPQFNW